MQLPLTFIGGFAVLKYCNVDTLVLHVGVCVCTSQHNWGWTGWRYGHSGAITPLRECRDRSRDLPAK